MKETCEGSERSKKKEKTGKDDNERKRGEGKRKKAAWGREQKEQWPVKIQKNIVEKRIEERGSQ